MESKKINQLATELAPELSDLTIIGDPTTGISKKITLSQMASLFTGTVEEYPNLASFPLVGTADTIYIALDTNIIYRWNTGTSAYVELSPNIVTSLVFNDANGFDGTISLVGSTATLTITTALTQGSIGFIGASGALTQDNSNFFWDNTNKRLGINTNTPTTAIDAFGSGIIGRLNGTSTNNAFLGFASAGSNKWSIGNVQSDHRFRIYNEATTSELVSVLQTGEFGIGIANPLTKLHIFGGASALIANLDANTSVAKSISFRSGNSSRINLEVSGTESGSNAGANFFIRRYSDAGALIDTPLTITRSTGYSYFSTNVIVGGTSASRKLQVNTSGNDGIRISTSGDNPTLDLMQTAAANASARNWRILTNWEGWGTLDFQSGTTNIEDPATTRFSISGTTGAATFSGTLNVNTDSNIIRFGNLLRWGFQRPAADNRYVSFYRTLHTTGAPVWTIDGDNGNIGIGTTTPNDKLVVDGGDNIWTGVFRATTTTSQSFGMQIFAGTNSNDTAFRILNGATTSTLFFVRGDGNVGIGTSNPSGKLAVLAGTYQHLIYKAESTYQSSLRFNEENNGARFYTDAGTEEFRMQQQYASTGFLTFYTGTTERMRITSGGYVKASNNGTYYSSGGSYHEFLQSASSNSCLRVFATSTSYDDAVQQINCYRTNNSAYSMAAFYSNNFSDLEFNFRGDGQAYADGSWNGGGADYAEFFEWFDGNPNNEDRRGYSVSLVGNKIKIAEKGETIIGVISGNPSVIGDSAWNIWTEKYLRDDFGTYVRDENGDRILNPNYNPDIEYIPREQRPEWGIVGLMGKLCVRKGQEVMPTWIKMKDVSDNVEQWLIK